MPLKGAGGHRLGTLCIFDSHPRRLTAEDGELLKDLAAIVEDELNNRELNRAISRLQESESKLEDFLENVGDIIMMGTVEDSGGRVLYANRAWKDRMGYDDNDLKALNVNDFISPENAA